MKRSWTWPVLMAVLLPGGMLIAVAWLLARSRGASPGGEAAAGSAFGAWRWPRQGDATAPVPSASSRRWEWPTAMRRARDPRSRAETLH